MARNITLQVKHSINHFHIRCTRMQSVEQCNVHKSQNLSFSTLQQITLYDRVLHSVDSCVTLMNYKKTPGRIHYIFGIRCICI